MQKIFTLIAVVALSVSSVFAANFTFQVDMRAYTGPAFTGVYVNADFNGWCGSCNPMFDPDGDDVWTLTIPLNVDTLEYKFTLDGWTQQENLTPGSPCTKTTGGFTNRYIVSSVDTIIPLVCYDSCVVCPGLTPPPAQNNVTFSVDMRDYTGPAFTNVFVNGNYNGWCGSCNIMIDPDNDSIWTTTLPITADSIEWKYTLDGWTYQENFVGGETCTKTTGGFTNRFVALPGNTVNLPTVCYNSCDPCNATPPPANDDTITFAVDMRGYAGSYTTVNINGTFNGWCGACNPMFDPDGDSIWTVAIPLPANDSIEYKFTVDGWTDQENFAGGETCTKTTGGFTNRFLAYSGNTLVDTVCWQTCAPCVGPPPAIDTVHFAVDMRGYSSNYTTVNLNGDFNGWCGGCNPMFDPDGDSIWTVSLPLSVDSIEYKFTVDGWTDQENFAGGEACTKTTGGFTNRFLIINGNVALDTVCWNDCGPCVGPPPPAPDTITFAVDMRGYAGSYTTVNLNGDFNGWCGGCNPMFDPDGDSIWVVSIPLSVDSIEYKFTVDGWTDQELFAGGEPCTKTTGGFTNRFDIISGNMVLDTVCWNDCGPCVGPPPSLDSVTFAVDMRGYSGNYTTVNLNGTFNGWCGGCNPMNDADGDSIWVLTLPLSVDSIEYKFTVDGWTDQENFVGGEPCTKTSGGFTNRFDIISGNTVLDTVCWNLCGPCGGPATSGDITFTVDMRGYMGGVNYTDVHLNGNFNGWCGTCNPMFDPDGDSIWSVTITLPYAAYEYKFTVDGWTDDEQLTSGDPCTITAGQFVNRAVTLSTPDLVLDTVCWESCYGCNINPCANITPDQDTLDNFECQRNITYAFANAGWQVVPNPDNSGVNQTSAVGRYERWPGLDGAFGGPLNLGPIDLTNDNQIKMHFHNSNPAVEVLMILQSTTLQDVGVASAWSNGGGQWETLNFDFSEATDSPDIANIVMLIGAGDTTTHNNIYYIDNIVLDGYALAPCSGVMADQDTLDDFECQDNIDYAFANAGWGEIANPVPGGVNNSATVGRYERWPGLDGAFGGPLTAGPISFADDNQVKMDFYNTNAPVEVLMIFQDGNLIDVGSAVAVSNGGGTWETLNFDLRAATSQTDVSNIVMLIGAGDTTSYNKVYYLDNIRLQGFEPVGIEDIQNGLNITVYPNPTNGTGAVSYELPESGEVEILLRDLQGRVVQEVMSNTFQTAGKQRVDFDMTNLQSGIYSVEVKINGAIASTKKVTRM